jgi:hypothetical protein
VARKRILSAKHKLGRKKERFYTWRMEHIPELKKNQWYDYLEYLNEIT